MNNFQRKETGIVLLSCLIFLLILLSLLQFTMTSARMEEMKAGADFDQMSAREAANLVMLDAENVIRRVNNNGESLQKAGVTDLGEIINLAIAYWSDDSNLNSSSGIYNGDNVSCSPFYECGGVNWNTTCGPTETSNGNAVCYGAITNANAISRSQGKYIIERFMGNGSVLGLGTTDEKAIILRVTGVGYSQPTQNGDNTSRVMLQNTYVLSAKR